MSEIFQNVFIGAVQGVSEFLPISSSGHLVIIPRLFSWDYQGLTFDVALHGGTVLAIILFFWKDWVSIIAKAIKYEIQNTKYEKAASSYPNNLLWQILVGSIPAGIVGLLIDDLVESRLHSSLLIAFNLVFFGFLLWYVDKKQASNLELSRVGYKQAFLVGLAQSVSLMPGVSRSGITMTAARVSGLNRESAARFSFLLGTPAMLGAFVMKMKDVAISDLGSAFWWGVASSAVFGFLAIKYLLQFLRKSDFAVFLWYRIAIAIIVLGFYFLS